MGEGRPRGVVLGDQMSSSAAATSQSVATMMMMLDLGLERSNEDEDSPLSMSDCESLENICDYEEIYQHKASVEQINVVTMDKQRVPKINKNKPITKIFKDKTFSPSLEDIKEVEDKSKDCSDDTPYLLSLAHVHYDRAFNAGAFLDQDSSGRNFRNEYWKSFSQQQRRMKKSSRRRTVSV